MMNTRMGARRRGSDDERPRLRVLLYSSAIQLEPILAMIPELSRKVELHVLLELAPDTWSSALFDVPPRPLPSGIVPAAPVLRECLPAPLHRYWQNASSFNFVVHNCRRSLHPATAWTSHKAARFVCGLRPDVIHLDNVQLRMGLALWEWRRIPMVLTVHDPEPHSGEGNWRSGVANRLTFPFVRRFVLYNESWAAPFAARIQVPRDRIDTMRLGVHGMCGEWEHEIAPEEEKTVLFFGRLSLYKGLEVLYRAAPLVAQKVKNVRFIVAGRPERGYTPPPPPQLPNGGEIQVVQRYLHNAEASQLFERAALVVCPNIDATQSGVVLTAFGFGKPVVATRVGGIPEYVENGVTGDLVEPNDPAALADALVRLLLDRSARLQMQANVRRHAQGEFSWRTFAGQMRQVYERTAHRSPGRTVEEIHSA